MQLSVTDVAELCLVSESTVFVWVQRDGLPAEQVNGLYRVNPSELLEWATSRQLPVSPKIFQKLNGDAVDQAKLSDALESGGVANLAGGDDRQAVLTELVKEISLPAGVPAETLVQLLLAREKMSSTAFGDGIAIPHPRSPVVLAGSQRMLRVAYLSQPIDFGAADGKPVDTLFLMICPTVHDHLQLLARLASVLQHDGFRKLLAQRPDKNQLSEAIRIEERALVAETA